MVAADLPWLALGVVVGTVTHLVWDSFTHAGRWGVEVVPWLHTEHLGLPGYKWAQFASGLLGLAVIVIWCLRRLADTAPDGDGLRSTGSERRVAWSLVVAGALTGAVVALLAFPGAPGTHPVPRRDPRWGGRGRRPGAGVCPVVGPHAAPCRVGGVRG